MRIDPKDGNFPGESSLSLLGRPRLTWPALPVSWETLLQRRPTIERRQSGSERSIERLVSRLDRKHPLDSFTAVE